METFNAPQAIYLNASLSLVENLLNIYFEIIFLLQFKLFYVCSGQENNLCPQARERQEIIYACTKLTQIQCFAVLPFYQQHHTEVT